ncbi:hypothetical protein PuT2_14745 [Pusillimonas sp. T2]|uniref:hypothetical protein n=1 Tax=Pusillimonas sp. T2 TaxID=1548123 RepID=UPI000B9CE529|nr:hypothetical protein [Pusillimonas sp. T2]OXR48053.1 hypothetical protein PuT2_14745 [Pusillimonas sp. T2]
MTKRMKIIGNCLDEQINFLPAGGIFGPMLPILAALGFIAVAFDFGMPGLEKAIAAMGMFAAGVLMSTQLPVWREAEPGELERRRTLWKISPAAPWIRMAKTFGWSKAAILFFVLCAALTFLRMLF